MDAFNITCINIFSIYTNIMNLTDALYATNATRGNAVTDRTTFTAAAPRTFVMGLQYNFTGKK